MFNFFFFSNSLTLQNYVHILVQITIFSISAPVNPIVRLAKISASTSRVRTLLRYRVKISLRPEKSGLLTVISVSKRPGLNRALSRSWRLFVAPKTMTPSF